MNDPDVSCRKQLERWVAEQVAERDEFKLPDLVDEAIAHFCGDAEWVRSFVEETMRNTVYTVALKAVGHGRRVAATPLAEAVALIKADRKSRAATDLRTAVREHLESTPAAWEARWQQWTEHDPVARCHYHLLDGSRDQLLASKSARFKRAHAEIRVCSLIDRLVERMGPEHVVRDVWTVAEIEAIAREIGIVASPGEPPDDAEPPPATGIGDAAHLAAD